jgi:predicted DNA-binding protein (MmcQ/YjbR family)
MAVPGAHQQITKAVLGWKGVTAHPHRFGGTEYRLGRRELGHIHGDRLVDIPFPKKIRDELVATGRANPHHILPESGWISFYIRNDTDVESAIRLLEESLKLAVKQRARRRTPTTE